MLAYCRHLPHLHPSETWLFLTWRLWGSLPLEPANHCYLTPGYAFVAQDRELDRQTSGPTWLLSPHIAPMIAKAILAGAAERRFYELNAWAVMPNHVHLLILPRVPAPQLTHWLKGTTARVANQFLSRTGQPFWQDESYDHYARNPSERDRIVRYIEHNPVSAGLVGSPGQWRWSSAGWTS